MGVDQPGAPVESTPIGVLYLDSRGKGALLSPDTRVALQTRGPRGAPEPPAAEAAVAIDNARLYRETIDKKRIEEELRMASEIQHALLPTTRMHGSFYDAEL